MVQLLITTAGHASRANLFSMSYTTAYLLCIAAFIFAVVCSINVKSTFNKYARIASRRGVTAAQAARQRRSISQTICQMRGRVLRKMSAFHFSNASLMTVWLV